MFYIKHSKLMTTNSGWWWWHREIVCTSHNFSRFITCEYIRVFLSYDGGHDDDRSKSFVNFENSVCILIYKQALTMYSVLQLYAQLTVKTQQKGTVLIVASTPILLLEGFFFTINYSRFCYRILEKEKRNDQKELEQDYQNGK